MATIEWQIIPPQKADNGVGKKRLYPRMKDNGAADMEQICQEVATDSVFSKAELIAAFEQVVCGIRRHLSEGHSVEITELGTFRLALGTDAVITESTRQRLSHIKVEGIHFQASKAMMQGVERPRFKESADRAQSPSSSAQDLIAPLTDYLQENGSITRRTFEQLFGLHRSTAAKRLQELTTQGILKAEGENRKRIYRLMDS